MTHHELLALVKTVLRDLGARAITEEGPARLQLGREAASGQADVEFCAEAFPLRLHINALLPRSVPDDQRERFNEAIARANFIAQFGRFLYDAPSGQAGYTVELILCDTEATSTQLKIYVRLALEAVKRFFPALSEILDRPRCDVGQVIGNVGQHLKADALRQARGAGSAAQRRIDEVDGT